MAEETEIIYQSEADLPVASSTSSIGHLRAVDTNGASALASPDQLREMVPYVGENIARNTNYVTGQWYWFAGQYAMPLTEPIIEGKTYTLSADIMSIIGDGFMWGLTTKWAEEGNFDLIMVTSAETAVIGERKTHTFTASKSYPIGAMLAFRGTNDSGGSAKNIKLELGSKSTPWVPASADMAQAMDYSLLTEQVVPGEFFPYKDGTKRQVYVRTFIGTTPSPDNVYGVILRTMLHVIVVRCTGNINGMMAGSTMFRPSEKDKQCSAIAISNTGDYGIGEVLITGTERGGNPYPDGLPYSISIFYIKS